MRSTFKILPYINRKRIKSDGTTAVLCRVSIDGKSILITTGIFCRPEDWNSQTGTIRQPRENNRLAEFRLNLERAYDRLLKEQGAVSAELLKNAVTGVATIPQTLLKGGEAERERLRLRAEQIHSTSTFRQSKTTQLNLQQFLQSRGLDHLLPADHRKSLIRQGVFDLGDPGGVRPFVQTVPEKGTGLCLRACEPLPVLAEPPYLYCGG